MIALCEIKLEEYGGTSHVIQDLVDLWKLVQYFLHNLIKRTIVNTHARSVILLLGEYHTSSERGFVRLNLFRSEITLEMLFICTLSKAISDKFGAKVARIQV